MPRETAVSLIKEQVLPRLVKVEGILIASGLDNGTGERAMELKRILNEGVSVEHRREITRQFLTLWFGWLPRLLRRLKPVGAAAWALLLVIVGAALAGWFYWLLAPHKS